MTRRVREGNLDLFLRCQGRKVHVLRAGPGDLVLEVPGDGWIAVGGAGTQVEEVAWPPDPAALGGWLASLAAAVGPEVPPRGADPVLAPSGRVPVWVRGEFRVLGEKDWSGWFPLVGGLWLVGSVREERPPEADLPQALEAFHAWVADRLRERAARQDREREERLHAQQEAEVRSLRYGLLSLGAVLSPEAERAAAAERPPIVEALLEVAQAAGLRLQVLREDLAASDDPMKALRRLCHRSGLRYRAVRLQGQWWRDDCGPLLGFRKDGAPVALLRQHGRYELPPEGLAPVGYTFYRTLPARGVGFTDLVAFALVGSGPDLVRLGATLVAGAMITTAIPIGVGLLFSHLIPEARRPELLELALGLGVAALASGLFQLVRGLAVARVQGRVDGSLEAAVWDRLLRLPVSFFRRYSAGELADRAMGLGLVREVLGGAVVAALLGAVVATGNLLVLLLLSPLLAVAALALSAVPVLVALLAARRRLPLERRILASQGDLSGLVLQLLTGIAKLRAAGAERRAFSLWAQRFARQRELAWRARQELNAVVSWNVAWPALATAGVFAGMARGGTGLTVGEFLAFDVAFSGFLSAIMALGPASLLALGMVPRFERVRPILETLPESAEGRAEPGELSGALEVSRVTFRYSPESPAVLHDVSLRVEPGEFVAVVGPSGSGKSSLFRLLLGFETPEAGAVYYDGMDLSHLDVSAVRRQIGVVLQNSGLMAGTILSNIVGTSAATQEDAWEAARLAGIEADLKAMPMGLQTRVGEGAETFSGGQRQRILVARALASRPRIVLFDEATSALDNPAQEVVSRSLERLRATRVVIAHRLSTIRHADRILVLHDGRIVQQGSYAELVGQPGPFRDLARRQLK